MSRNADPRADEGDDLSSFIDSFKSLNSDLSTYFGKNSHLYPLIKSSILKKAKSCLHNLTAVHPQLPSFTSFPPLSSSLPNNLTVARASQVLLTLAKKYPTAPIFSGNSSVAASIAPIITTSSNSTTSSLARDASAHDDDEIVASGYIRALLARMLHFNSIIVAPGLEAPLPQSQFEKSLAAERGADDDVMDEENNFSEISSSAPHTISTSASFRNIVVCEYDARTRSRFIFTPRSSFSSPSSSTDPSRNLSRPDSATLDGLHEAMLLFFHAGKSLFLHGRDYASAYDNFCLSLDVFNNGIRPSFGESLVPPTEVFSTMAMICDACAKCSGGGAAPRSKTMNILRSHLTVVNSYVLQSCDDPSESMTMLRELASLLFNNCALFAKVGESDLAISTIRDTLRCTDRYLAAIDPEEQTSSQLSSSSAFTALTLESVRATNEMSMISCESFYILAHIYSHDQNKHAEAVKCLDKILEYIEERKQRDAKFLLTTPNQPYAKESSKLYDCEVAKTIFARAIIKLRKGDAEGASQEVGQLLASHSRSIIEDPDIFAKSLTACRALAVDEVARNRSPTAGAISHYDRLLSIIDKTKDAAERKFSIKTDEVLSTISGLKLILDGATTEMDTRTDTTSSIAPLGARARAVLTQLVDSARGSEEDKQLESLLGVASSAMSLWKVHNMHEDVISWGRVALAILLKMNERQQSEHIKEFCETKSAIAYANTMTLPTTENLTAALNEAREAFLRRPTSSRMLAVWFHCALCAQRGGLIDSEALLRDLDLHLEHSRRSSMKSSEMLSAFSMMSFACDDLSSREGVAPAHQRTIENSSLLLNILLRWTKKQGEPDGDFMRSVICKRELQSKVVTSPTAPSLPPLLSLIRTALLRFETCIGASKVFLPDFGRQVLIALDVGLALTQLVRERGRGDDSDHRGSTAGVESDMDEGAIGQSIWDDAETKTRLGDQSDCIWVAEQCWNLGLNAIGCQECQLASDFFARAHDFALLAYEEEGNSLTQGCLTVEGQDTVLPASSLSSEFSAQCLVMSASALIDSSQPIAFDDECDDNRITTERILWMVRVSKLEIADCSEEVKSQSAALLDYLELRVLLEQKNDALALAFLKNEDSKQRLFDFFSTDNNIELLGACAARAELRSKRRTARMLYDMRSQFYLTGKGADSGGSYGTVMKKLVTLATSVTDVIDVFEKVAELCVKKGKSEETPLRITDNEVNWFCIEAYNKGISLMFLGDAQNAVALLSISLNLVPFAGKEIYPFKATISGAYCAAVDVGTQNSNLESSVKSSRTRMATLFECLPY